MKNIFLSALIVVLVIGSSVHLSIIYLNYMRTLGMGFTSGISVMKPDIYKAPRKDIFKVVDL